MASSRNLRMRLFWNEGTPGFLVLLLSIDIFFKRCSVGFDGEQESWSWSSSSEDERGRFLVLLPLLSERGNGLLTLVEVVWEDMVVVCCWSEIGSSEVE